MDLIKTSIGLTKTIKNVSRLKEIVSIFARHGFDEFVTSGVTSKIPDFVLPKSQKGIKDELASKEDREWPEVIGFRLRQCFEEMGPAFIKFGQLLASREDLFDPAFTTQMSLLRDKVKPIPFSQMRQSVEASLGKKIEEVFSEVEDAPIGTASIGVVYRAKLLDGTSVVMKVRRPHIEKEIQTDFAILKFIALQTEKVSSEVKYLGVSRIIHDFTLSLQTELNFNIEALNAKRFAKNLATHDTKKIYVVPEIYQEYCREDIIVMQEMQGIPFSNTEKILPVMKDVQDNLLYGVELFMKTFLKDGFFHADLHGGNFFYLDNGQIGLIDFGLMGSLGNRSRKNFIAIIYALVTYNYENLIYEFLDVADYEEVPDIDHLIQDVRDALSPFVGLTVQQTNFSAVLLAVVRTLKKHQLYLPREWYIVFRSLITLDGVGKSVQIDLDIFAIFEKDIQGIIKSAINKDELLEEGLWTARDLITSSRTFPRHLKWFLKTWSKNGYRFEVIHTGHENSFKTVSSAIVFLGFAILSGVLFYSGVSFLKAEMIQSWKQIPVITWLFWTGGLGLLAFGMGYLKERD